MVGFGFVLLGGGFGGVLGFFCGFFATKHSPHNSSGFLNRAYTGTRINLGPQTHYVILRIDAQTSATQFGHINLYSQKRRCPTMHVLAGGSFLPGNCFVSLKKPLALLQ